MKYKDLPSERLIQKLLATSFESPAANREVFYWCESVLSCVRFLESERIKLVKKHGTADEDGNIKVPKENYKAFAEDFEMLLHMRIDKEIPKCPIEREWFDDERCSFAPEKNLWISPAEIGKVLELNKEKAG